MFRYPLLRLISHHCNKGVLTPLMGLFIGPWGVVETRLSPWSLKKQEASKNYYLVIIFMSQTKNYDLVIIFWPTLLEKSLDSCSCMHASCTYSRGVAAVLHQQQSQQSSLAEQLLTGWCFYTSSQPLTWWCFYTSSLWWKRLQSKCKNTPSLGLSSLQAGITPVVHFTLHSSS